jgi:hypothetical protein
VREAQGEAQGALPLDPAKEPFEKRFFGISKTFYHFFAEFPAVLF